MLLEANSTPALPVFGALFGDVSSPVVSNCWIVFVTRGRTLSRDEQETQEASLHGFLWALPKFCSSCGQLYQDICYVPKICFRVGLFAGI